MMLNLNRSITGRGPSLRCSRGRGGGERASGVVGFSGVSSCRCNVKRKCIYLHFQTLPVYFTHLTILRRLFSPSLTFNGRWQTSLQMLYRPLLDWSAKQ